MKYIYDNSYLRCEVKKGFDKSIFRHYFQLVLQERKKIWFFKYWSDFTTVKIEFYEFCTFTEEEKQIPQVCSGSFGTLYEVWYPEYFDLSKRIKQLFGNYYNIKRNQIIKSKIVQKHWQSID